MTHFCFLILMTLAGPGASADSILEDLVKVDQLDCDIEAHGDQNFRVLATPYNLHPDRYLDLNLADPEFKFRKNNEGWTLSRDVDLGEKAIAPLFPKFMFGTDITRVTFTRMPNGSSLLTVRYTNSLRLFGPIVKFRCMGEGEVSNDKSARCPNCVSVRQHPK